MFPYFAFLNWLDNAFKNTTLKIGFNTYYFSPRRAYYYDLLVSQGSPAGFITFIHAIFASKQGQPWILKKTH